MSQPRIILVVDQVAFPERSFLRERGSFWLGVRGIAGAEDIVNGIEEDIEQDWLGQD